MRASSILLVACVIIGGGTLIAMRPPVRVAAPVVSRTPTPVTAPRAPEVRATDPVRGPTPASHTIIVFSDFTCPSCAAAAQTLEELRASRADSLRIVWKDAPILNRITRSRQLHIAARCAQVEGRFWEFHDAFFSARPATLEMIDALATTHIPQRARFDTCRTGTRGASLVDADLHEATALGLTGTPTIFVDGRLFTDTITTEHLTNALALTSQRR
ncbi:thioredoxin domain-containing protein [Candidatus Uhrbacteria bacterium]|nr:thioredoxin domain-containing protein [Candidatus Uhrbacteria bacterium]